MMTSSVNPRDWYANIWGKRINDDDLMFELMSLQVFQAGLKWHSILNKRDAFKVAFEGWNINRVAGFKEHDVIRLLSDNSIIRNRRKIEACVFNALVIRTIKNKHGSFCHWFYEILEGETLEVLQKKLRPLFRFMGPEIARMWLLAVGKIDNG